MTKLLAGIYGLCMLVFSAPSFSQQKLLTATELKKIADRFPEEQFFSTDEKIAYTFSLVQRGKLSLFLIKENYSAGFFTTEPDYSQVNSVLYDDYSKVTLLNCSVNGLTIPSFPVVHTNYESEGIFHDDMKLCAYKLNMVKGKSYRVNYTKEYENPRLFSKVYFSESYPLHKKTISFEIPEWVDVEIKPINFDGYTITQKETSSLVLGKKVKKIIYEMEDVDAFQNEPHSQNLAKYLPHLLVFVKSYKGTKQSEKYFSTHEDIYTWCKTLVDSVDNESESLLPIFKEIVKNETDTFRMMESIFYWVQEHVRYIAFEDGIMGYKPMPAKKVCNMLYGDCKGMANLTKSLLKLAGIDARLTWIGTNDIPYNNDIPSLAVYNHMICTAFLNNKKYFLDATEDYIAIDDYAERIQGRPVMIENGNSYLVDKIPYFGCERNKSVCTIEYSIDGTKLKGVQALSGDGEQKTSMLRAISSLKSESREQAIKSYLRSNNSNISISSYSISDLTNRIKPLEIKCSFEVANSVYSSFPGRMLLFPEKDFEFEGLEFDSLRKNDYEFTNRYFINTTTVINLPANYTVLKAPATVEIKNEDYEFYLKYEVAGTSVKMIKSMKVKNILLRKSQFDAWNAEMKKLKDFYRSPLILKTS